MSTLAKPISADGASPAGDPDDCRIRSQVNGLLAGLYPRHELAERRRDRRYPFPYLIHLTPMDGEGTGPAGEALVVVGKHLSQRGLGFYHPMPLPHRRVIASLQTDDGRWVGFLMDLSWCRFTREAWYESGGRFLGVVPSPMASPKAVAG